MVREGGCLPEGDGASSDGDGDDDGGGRCDGRENSGIVLH